MIEEEEKKQDKSEEEEGDKATPEENKEEEKTDSPLDTAANLVAQMKEQNDKFSANLKRQEKLVAEDMLGGRSGMGKSKSAADKDTDEARKILEGTGYADELFPK